MPNTGRFRRVERCLHRHVRAGELGFVGRQGGKVIWRRLRTHDLHVARAKAAMIDSNTNGNTAIFLVVDGREQPLPEAKPVVRDEPLPRVRQVMQAAESPAAPTNGLPAAQPAPSGPVPTLDEFLNRWRRVKAGLKPATEARLDDCLTTLRRYVDTSRPATDYKPQDIRDYLAKARADKVKGRRRLKGQTINEAIWRLLDNAFALALEERFIDRNPMASVDREKTTQINRTQHSWADAERILEDVKHRASESYLELKFMLLLGVGQAEAKDLMGDSVDWNEDETAFIRRKTGKQNTTASAERPYLSKSKFLWGSQCRKLVWYAYNAKDQIPEPDAATQAIFDQGHEVGALAKTLYPGGVEVSADATDFEHVPFQFSLHRQPAAGAKPEHHGFLAEGRGDPRPEFLNRLRDCIGDNGTVVVYNAKFEQGVLDGLADAFPDHAGWIGAVEARIIDLLEPFQTFDYYHGEQHGSASIKAVLPVLTGRSYTDLEIQEGGQASLEYLRVHFGNVPEAERQRVREQLERYCGQDTEGMIWIVAALRRLAG